MPSRTQRVHGKIRSHSTLAVRQHAHGRCSRPRPPGISAHAACGNIPVEGSASGATTLGRGAAWATAPEKWSLSTIGAPPPTQPARAIIVGASTGTGAGSEGVRTLASTAAAPARTLRRLVAAVSPVVAASGTGIDDAAEVCPAKPGIGPDHAAPGPLQVWWPAPWWEI